MEHLFEFDKGILVFNKCSPFSSEKIIYRRGCLRFGQEIEIIELRSTIRPKGWFALMRKNSSNFV